MQSTTAVPAMPPVGDVKQPSLTLHRGGASSNGKTRRKNDSVRPRPSQFIRIEFEIHRGDGPALRSAIEEISNEVGGRLEGPHSFATEQALTNAARALGAFRAAVNAVIRKGDPDYKARTSRRAV